ncbi:hypothetical protein OCU04_003944 [Sclerotinia nivalis]|uniref:Uncharacterized protein n=1 Tax=Sclerotinia nivalis TaxID=352851 RepID=A0A9X0AT22_9HELO|nr:hypothetical protein OCU04_003944 [Sclerotinia nivalis]
MDCVHLAEYGESIVGAPFVFSSLDVDEDLSNETDVIGVNPSDIGHFSVQIYRRKMEEFRANIPTKPQTGL